MKFRTTLGLVGLAIALMMTSPANATPLKPANFDGAATMPLVQVQHHHHHGRRHHHHGNRHHHHGHRHWHRHGHRHGHHHQRRHHH